MLVKGLDIFLDRSVDNPINKCWIIAGLINYEKAMWLDG